MLCFEQRFKDLRETIILVRSILTYDLEIQKHLLKDLNQKLSGETKHHVDTR